MYYRDRIFFSAATKLDLRADKLTAEKALHLILLFCKNNVPKKLMITYDDEKGHKKPALTEKSLARFMEEYRKSKIGLLTVTDYMSAETYYNDYDFDPEQIVFESNITFGSPSYAFPNSCDTVSVSMKYPGDETCKELVKLFFELHTLLNGIGSFLTHGTDVFHAAGLFDFQYYGDNLSFSRFWDEQVRGYFWLTFLTDKQIELLGGIEKLDGHGFYKIEKTDTGVFIQCTENILDYTLEDALKLREVLLPLFPPIKERTSKLFPSIEDIGEHRLYLFDIKDMIK